MSIPGVNPPPELNGDAAECPEYECDIVRWFWRRGFQGLFRRWQGCSEPGRSLAVNPTRSVIGSSSEPEWGSLSTCPWGFYCRSRLWPKFMPSLFYYFPKPFPGPSRDRPPILHALTCYSSSERDKCTHNLNVHHVLEGPWAPPVPDQKGG